MRFGLLKKLFTRAKLPTVLRYEDARAALESRSLDVKRELAARRDAPPETLYYLAGDPDASVRTLVAANPATPLQADESLVNDEEGEVRVELARKIARVVPDMHPGEVKDVRDRVMTLFERLARDELSRVRQIVAEEIKSCPAIPKRIAVSLARDAEILVCGPVLEYSPLLSDEDLLEIVATSRVQGALEAIARRRSIDGSLADAIVATLEIPAIAQLLANPRAEIRDETLDRIIAEAASIEAWHLPLVMRPALSLRAVRRIAVFVSRALIEELGRNRDIDADTQIYLKAKAQARIEQDADRATQTPDAVIAGIRKAFKHGELGDDLVTKAASLQHKAAVALALSLKTGVAEQTVLRILDAKSGKGIAALCWRAGLAMRTALAIQIFVANVPSETRVLPRGGVDYPMDEEEMLWHLNYFGIGTTVMSD
ncbi:MAG: DUF2336 domain-containing protein [Parvibaculum sp.]|uniref:DUF2336 domain-containing protein n=1 Tax=Parvibaculum sp. TaxID=2024848 RepID=UPI0025D2357B|nr:DUF2336 domain-containing protein [Parvibaculum sp.]MCE9650992.1 DUF2336 domain-containing protein [Parvibaculum sp.]